MVDAKMWPKPYLIAVGIHHNNNQLVCWPRNPPLVLATLAIALGYSPSRIHMYNQKRNCDM